MSATYGFEIKTLLGEQSAQIDVYVEGTRRYSLLINAQDEAVRQALIALGWTPPGGAVSAGDPHLWGRAEAACRAMHGTDWDTMYSGDQESNIRAWIAGYTAATQEKGATSRSA